MTRTVQKRVRSRTLWKPAPNLVCKCLPVALPQHPHPRPHLATVTASVVASVLLLTGALRVDECVGLMAQCAYLIGAALLSRCSFSLSLSHPLLPHSCLFSGGGGFGEESVPLG